MTPMNWNDFKLKMAEWFKFLKRLNPIFKGFISILKGFSSILKWISSNGAAFILFFALIVAFEGRRLYDLPFLYPVEELAGRMDESRQKRLDYKEKLNHLKLKKQLLHRHLNLGNSFLNDDRHEAAKKEFDRALGLDPLNIRAQQGLSKVSVYEDFSDKKNYNPETVRRRIDAILKENKTDPHANALMGNLRLRLNDPEKALAHYDIAINSDAKIASAYFGKGCLYQFHFNDPVKDPDKATGKDPGKDPEKATGKRLDNALEMYETAVRLSPWNTRYLDNLATIYVEKKKFKTAIETYKKIMRTDPDFILPYFEIARPYFFSGHPKMALQYLEHRALAGLNDPEKTAADKNRLPWVFKHKTKTVYISTIAQKKYYVLRLMTEIAAIQKKQTQAQSYANRAVVQAKKIDPFKKDAINELALVDINRFKNRE